jgi:hypothetical protein
MKTSRCVFALLFTAAFAAPLDSKGKKSEDNDSNSAGCKPLEVVFARGTDEPTRTGILTGAPFKAALELKYPGKVNFQAVPYSASIVGYLSGGSGSGAAKMANMITETAKRCPRSKIIIGGYSQGGQVTHKAAKKLSSSVSSRVNGVVIFGDPDKGRKLKDIGKGAVDTICAASDPICAGIPIPLGSHLTYSTSANKAANWVHNKLGGL